MAIVASTFGFTCLGVLVVVTAIDDQDALSTVALALAILAFSAQLIVFIAQQNAAAEQGRRNEELYGSMQGVLAEIREKAAGTQADVRTINERMLGAILSKNLAETPSSSLDPSRVASQVAREVAQLGQRINVPEPKPSEMIWPERRPTPDDERIVQSLRSFPPEDEVGNGLEILKQLAPADRVFLKGFGDDEINARRPGSPFDPSLPLSMAANLTPFGLVEPYPPDLQPKDAPPIARLTDYGRSVARLLTAEGSPPPYLHGLNEIRSGLADES